MSKASPLIDDRTRIAAARLIAGLLTERMRERESNFKHWFDSLGGITSEKKRAI